MLAEVSDLHEFIRDRLAPHFAELARCDSTKELVAHPLYRKLLPSIETVLSTLDTGDFRTHTAEAQPSYRFVAWNLERGTEVERQIEALRHDPYLSKADVLLLTELDIGMARSANRDIPRLLARELGMQYAFAPCYLNLTKGAGAECEAQGENQLGLHGNAILSRYPIENARAVLFPNGRDKMRGREKRLGSQTAVLAEIRFPGSSVTAAAVHLDAQSTQRHRYEQMRLLLDAIPPEGPAIIGGDWNTSTYNSSRALHAIIGFAVRVLMGVGNVIRNHYLHPYHRFERDLFQLLENRGFDYRSSNLLGVRTAGFCIADERANKNLGEWVPAWCFHFIRWALRNHGGKCPLKLDWFAARGLRCKNPTVLHAFREERAVPLSDHDPIGIDVVV